MIRLRRTSDSERDVDEDERRFSGPNNLTLKLLKTICSKDGSFQNGVYSPIGLQASFTFFNSCAGSQTQSELRQAFKFTVHAADLVATHNDMLYSIADSDFIVHVCVIIDKNIKIEKSFYSYLKKFNKVDVRFIDFSTPAKVHKQIRNFFADQQWKGDRISMLGSVISLTVSSIGSSANVDSIKPSLENKTILILNYTYLKCKLSSNSFDKGSQMQKFYTSDSVSFEMEMLHCCVVLRTLRHSRLRATLIEIPLQNTNNILMYIILPTKSNGLVQTEAALSEFNLSLVLSQFRYALVDLTLPRFSAKHGISLKEVLQDNGINSLFRSGECSLPLITDENVAVDYVYQTSGIDFANIVDGGKVEKQDKKDAKMSDLKDQQEKEYARSRKETILVNYPFLYVVRQNDIAGRERSILIGKFTGVTS